MLRIVPHTVPRVGRSHEHFSDGFELQLLQVVPCGHQALCADCARLVGVSLLACPVHALCLSLSLLSLTNNLYPSLSLSLCSRQCLSSRLPGTQSLSLPHTLSHTLSISHTLSLAPRSPRRRGSPCLPGIHSHDREGESHARPHFFGRPPPHVVVN